VNGEIILHDESIILEKADDMMKTSGSLGHYLNSLEAFAIPFVAGVADDDLGFQETALSFCRSTREAILTIAALRKAGGARYESCVRLYDSWSKRLQAEDLKKKMKDLENKIRETSDVPKIKPVGGV